VTVITPNQILLLYSWFPLAAVIAILLLIARFYETFSGDRTYYLLYLIPLVLFGAGIVRYASVDQIAGDALGDIFMGAAGAVLLILSIWLYHQMTSGRKS
jgi:hypothetical protein